MPSIVLTPTSYLVLGLIEHNGESTPYQLRQIMDQSVGHFWWIPRSQLYAEPERLTKAEYLNEDRELEGRRRKHYSMTDQGHQALEDWTAEPTDTFTELRDLALLKVYFGADPRTMAQRQLEALRPRLELYEQMQREAEGLPPGPAYALIAGIAHVRTSVDLWEAVLADSEGKMLKPSGGRRPSACSRGAHTRSWPFPA